MDFRQSVLGEIAIRSGVEFVGADIGKLVRRLILFDRTIIKSYRLREVPILVRTFGKSGFRDLLTSGILKINCEFTAIINDIQENGKRHIPLNHFSFGVAEIQNRDGILQTELKALQSISGLKNHERATIEQAVLDSMVRPPKTFGADVQQQIEHDLRTNSDSLRNAILQELRARYNRANLLPGQINIQVIEEPRPRVFHIKNTFPADFGISPSETHQLLFNSVSAVATLTQRLAEMQCYSAITGFLQSDATMLFGKLSEIIAPLNPKVTEEQFERVIQLADIPDFAPGQRVDVDKLMNIRDSAECRDFRGWLTTLEGIPDEDIKRMVTGVRNKLALLTNSKSGKIVRLVINTAIGAIPGAGLLPAALEGVVDSFLLDKVLPTSGVFAFLTDTYPSLFTSH